MAKKSKRTGIAMVPLMDDAGMAKLMKALKAAGLKGSAKACGQCDEIAGVTWCNVSVPSANYKLTLTKEF